LTGTGGIRENEKSRKPPQIGSAHGVFIGDQSSSDAKRGLFPGTLAATTAYSGGGCRKIGWHSEPLANKSDIDYTVVRGRLSIFCAQNRVLPHF